MVYEGANKEIDSAAAIKSIVDFKPDLLLIQFETNEDVVISCVNEAVKNNITTVIDCGPAKAFELELTQQKDVQTDENQTRERKLVCSFTWAQALRDVLLGQPLAQIMIFFVLLVVPTCLVFQ